MIYKKRESDIQRAIRLLEEAAKLKEEEVKNCLKSVFSPRMTNLTSNAQYKIAKSYSRIENVMNGGQELVKSIVGRWQHEALGNPWIFLRKVAMTSFGLGFIVGGYYKYWRENAKNFN